MKYEILALVEWAAMLKDDDCTKQFCTTVVPILESWAILSAPLGEEGSNAASGGTSASGASGVAVPKLGRKLRNKEAHTLSMYQLAVSQTSVGSGKPSPLLELLNPTERSCFDMISALSVALSVEQVLTKDTLLALAGQVRQALVSIDLPIYGAELLHRSNLKSIEKLTYSSGRQRTSRIKYAEYNPAGGPSGGASDDRSGMFHDYVARGKNLNLSTNVPGPGLIAWNKIRRNPIEEPLVTAANRISLQAGVLARQLLDRPHDAAIANAFYKEVLLHIDPLKANGSIELQLPLNRLAISAPTSAVAQIMAGHEYAIQRKHYLALDKYFTAFCLDPEQPMTSLCIGKDDTLTLKFIVSFLTLV